jgi:hypothetical protein
MVDLRGISSKVAHALTEVFWALPTHAWGRPNPKPNAGIWGDLDEVELVTALEVFFEVSLLQEPELETMQSLGEMHDLLVLKRPDLSEDKIWTELCRITSEYGGEKPSEFTRETMFLCRIYE